MNDTPIHSTIDIQEEQDDSQHSSTNISVIDNAGNTKQSSSKSETSPTLDAPKPKEKRKFSLADYKRRRQQQQQTTQNDITTPEASKYQQSVIENQKQDLAINTSESLVIHNSDNSSDTSFVSAKNVKMELSPLPESSINEVKSTLTETIQQSIQEPESLALKTEVGNADLGGSTPTMDEEQIPPVTTLLSSVAMTDVTALPSASAPITLNPLPLFEKLEKLEKAQKENKKKALGNVSPPPEPKREDLTERLKKEFGLTVDGDDDTPISEEEVKKVPTSSSLNFADGDATPEEDSPPPPSV